MKERPLCINCRYVVAPLPNSRHIEEREYICAHHLMLSTITGRPVVKCESARRWRCGDKGTLFERKENV